MPEPLTSDIISFHFAAYSFSAELQNLYNDVLALQTGLLADGAPNAANAAGNMAIHLWNLRGQFAYGSDSIRYWLVKTLQYIDSNAFNGGGGGVTMADILAEMMSASFEELTSFMGITQAYKVAVWDAPFNEEFYAALARGFKTWGA